MTNRELFEQVIKDMTDEELADFVSNSDLKNMAVFDNTIPGSNDKEKILNFLREEIKPLYTFEVLEVNL